jgi:hypothetical protein
MRNEKRAMDDHYQRNEPRKYSKTWKSRAKSKQYSKWWKSKAKPKLYSTECVGEVEKDVVTAVFYFSCAERKRGRRMECRL